MAEWTGWGGGRNPQPVAMTVEHAKSLVDAVVEAVVERVAKASDSNLIEQYKQFARLEAELKTERDNGERKDAEIAALRAHIDSLNMFVTNRMTPAPGTQLLATQPAPHVSASYPVQPPRMDLPYPGAPTYYGQPLSSIRPVSSPPAPIVDGVLKNSSSPS